MNINPSRGIFIEVIQLLLPPQTESKQLLWSTHNPLCPVQHADVTLPSALCLFTSDNEGPHLLFRDVEPVSSQNHKPVPPQLPEDPTATELPDPAHFVRLLSCLWSWVLNALKQTSESDRKTIGLTGCSYWLLLLIALTSCFFTGCCYDLNEWMKRDREDDEHMKPVVLLPVCFSSSCPLLRLEAPGAMTPTAERFGPSGGSARPRPLGAR